MKPHDMNTADALAAAVELLNAHRNWSLSFHEKVYGDDDDLPTHGEWVVWKETGNINDREWLVAGVGDTAKEAIINAVRAE